MVGRSANKLVENVVTRSVWIAKRISKAFPNWKLKDI